MKPRIFIGSSSEGLPYAEQVKQLLQKKGFDLVLWNDGQVFGLSTSYLDSLLKAGSMFDFGILVATKDDLVDSRNEINYAARDNVLFEYGLFMGRLGKFRTLILMENGVKRPSDIEGIHISTFEKEENSVKSMSLMNATNIISEHIKERYKLPELGLLPSTSVAAGFYENFLNRVCDYLRNKDSIEIKDVKYNSFEIQVVIPTRLQHDMQNSADYYFKVNNFEKHAFQPEKGRDIRTRIAQGLKQPDKLIICDIPTTLTAVYDSIEMYLPHGHTESKEFQLIESREINNFIAVLKSKLNRDPFSKSIVNFIEYNF